MPAKVVLATLCLNEMEWLPSLYAQHKNWPGLVKWAFVESADRVYAETNPGMISDGGLSNDGTTEYLNLLSKTDEKIIHIPYGFCGFDSRYPLDQHKCEARNQYLNILNQYEPDLLIVLDADEFYTYDAQTVISEILNLSENYYQGSAFCFNQRHIWYPPLLQTSRGKLEYPQYRLFTHEALGGYWRVIHCRVWKWEPNLKYHKNHNWPEDQDGTFLTHKKESMLRTDERIPHFLSGVPLPECIHLGYASQKENRVAKHRYYENRGEGKEEHPILRRKRRMYVECRNDYLSWEPGGILSHDASVIPYTGPIPEVFRERYAHHR